MEKDPHAQKTSPEELKKTLEDSAMVIRRLTFWFKHFNYIEAAIKLVLWFFLSAWVSLPLISLVSGKMWVFEVFAWITTFIVIGVLVGPPAKAIKKIANSVKLPKPGKIVLPPEMQSCADHQEFIHKCIMHQIKRKKQGLKITMRESMARNIPEG